MDYYDLKNKIFLISQKAIITDGEKVLVLKNTGEWTKGVSEWELPGGLLEMEEDFEKGLKREVLEETKLNIEIEKIITLWSDFYNGFKFKNGDLKDVRIVNIAFVCKKIGGEVKLSGEHLEYLWVDREQLKNLDFSGNTNFAIEKFLELD